MAAFNNFLRKHAVHFASKDAISLQKHPQESMKTRQGTLPSLKALSIWSFLGLTDISLPGGNSSLHVSFCTTFAHVSVLGWGWILHNCEETCTYTLGWVGGLEGRDANMILIRLGLKIALWLQEERGKGFLHNLEFKPQETY